MNHMLDLFPDNLGHFGAPDGHFVFNRRVPGDGTLDCLSTDLLIIIFTFAGWKYILHVMHFKHLQAEAELKCSA